MVNLITQDIVKLPELQTHVSLMGRKTAKLPDKGTVLVQGHRQKPYPVKLTSKTKYNWKDLRFKTDSKFIAQIDTDTQPWTVYSINLESNFDSELNEGIYELGGDY